MIDGYAQVPAELNKGSVPITEASTSTEDDRCMPCMEHMVLVRLCRLRRCGYRAVGERRLCGIFQ